MSNHILHVLVELDEGYGESDTNTVLEEMRDEISNHLQSEFGEYSYRRHERHDRPGLGRVTVV